MTPVPCIKRAPPQFRVHSLPANPRLDVSRCATRCVSYLPELCRPVRRLLPHSGQANTLGDLVVMHLRCVLQTLSPHTHTITISSLGSSPLAIAGSATPSQPTIVIVGCVLMVSRLLGPHTHTLSLALSCSLSRSLGPLTSPLASRDLAIDVWWRSAHVDTWWSHLPLSLSCVPVPSPTLLSPLSLSLSLSLFLSLSLSLCSHAPHLFPHPVPESPPVPLKSYYTQHDIDTQTTQSFSVSWRHHSINESPRRHSVRCVPPRILSIVPRPTFPFCLPLFSTHHACFPPSFFIHFCWFRSFFPRAFRQVWFLCGEEEEIGLVRVQYFFLLLYLGCLSLLLYFGFAFFFTFFLRFTAKTDRANRGKRA